MAEQVLTKAFLSINAVDLSAKMRRINTPQGVERQDDSAFGDDSRSGAGGLKTWSIDAEFNQDFAAGSVDATLSGIVGTVVAIEYRPSTDAVSSTNPKWTGSGLIEEYIPVAGTVGDQAIATVRIGSAGRCAPATESTWRAPHRFRRLESKWLRERTHRCSAAEPSLRRRSTRSEGRWVTWYAPGCSSPMPPTPTRSVAHMASCLATHTPLRRWWSWPHYSTQPGRSK